MIRKYLGSGRVGNPLDVNPVGRLLVFRVVDLLGWVDGWLEVGEQATGFRLAIVNADGVGVIGAKRKCQGVDQRIA
jgi:hypothetical protein